MEPKEIIDDKNSNQGPKEEGDSLKKTIYCYEFSDDPKDAIVIDNNNIVSDYLTSIQEIDENIEIVNTNDEEVKDDK